MKAWRALRKAAKLNAVGKRDEAIKALDTAIASSDSDRDNRLRIRRGLLAGDGGDFDTLINEQVSSAPALFFAANHRYKIGELDSAAKLCVRAAEKSPGNLSVQALYGIIKFINGEHTTLQAISRVLPHASADIQAAALLETEKAILMKHPNDTGEKGSEPSLAGPIGWLMDRLDDLAVTIYWIISHLMNILLNLTNRQKRSAWRKIINGDRLYQLGKQEEAAKLFKQALKIDPDALEPAEVLVSYYLEKQEYVQAKKYLNMLINATEEGEEIEPALNRRQADLLFGTGQYEAAGKMYQELFPEFRLDHMIPYRAGLCHIRQGDENNALAWFKKSLNLINHGLLENRISALAGIY